MVRTQGTKPLSTLPLGLPETPPRRSVRDTKGTPQVYQSTTGPAKHHRPIRPYWGQCRRISGATEVSEVHIIDLSEAPPTNQGHHWPIRTPPHGPHGPMRASSTYQGTTNLSGATLAC